MAKRKKDNTATEQLRQMDEFDPTKGHTCSICHATYTGWGNNAAPYGGRCCDICNTTHVIPARLGAIRSR